MASMTLLDKNRILDLAAQAIESLQEEYEEDNEVDFSIQHDLVMMNLQVAMDALRLCGRAAVLLGDPQLIGHLLNWIAVIEHYQDDDESTKSQILTSVKRLLESGAPVGDEVRELAVDKDWEARNAVAEGLRPDSPIAIELLERLSCDRNRGVRSHAREKISKIRPVPWWSGVFERDPLCQMTDEQASTLKPTIEELIVWMRRPMWETDDKVSQLSAILDKLPDALAVEACERFLQDPEQRYRGSDANLDVYMVRRPGGLDAIWRVIRRAARDDEHFLDGSWVKDLMPRLDPPTRRSLCQNFLEILKQSKHAERLGWLNNPYSAIAEALEVAWPEDADVGPILDMLLQWLPPTRNDQDNTSAHLVSLLERENLNRTSVMERMVCAFVEGCPAPWQPLSRAVQRAVESLPAEQKRHFVEPILSKEGDSRLAWALEQQTGPLYDPDLHGPRLSLVARLWVEPPYRKAITSSALLSRRAMPFLREQLLLDLLTLPEAVQLIAAIQSMYGGSVFWGFRSPNFMNKDPEEEQRNIRESVAQWIGLAKLEGPAGPGEWDAFRRLQKKALEQSDQRLWVQVLEYQPIGPWHPADRELLEGLQARLPEATQEAVALQIAKALHCKPQLQDLPIFDALIANERRARRKYLIHLLKEVRKQFVTCLNIDDPALVDQDKSQEPEWMDQPDDGEDE